MKVLRTMNSLRMYVLTTHYGYTYYGYTYYGYTYYGRTMNSLRMSFWMVPLSCACKHNVNPHGAGFSEAITLTRI